MTPALRLAVGMRGCDRGRAVLSRPLRAAASPRRSHPGAAAAAAAAATGYTYFTTVTVETTDGGGGGGGGLGEMGWLGGGLGRDWVGRGDGGGPGSRGGWKGEVQVWVPRWGS